MLRRVRQKSPVRGGPGLNPSPAIIESTIQSGDSLMSVVPSIIVLMITALIVFRREITAWAAPGAKQHRWHRTMPSPRPRVTQPSGMTPRAHTQPRVGTGTGPASRTMAGLSPLPLLTVGSPPLAIRYLAGSLLGVKLKSPIGARSCLRQLLRFTGTRRP